MSGWGAKPKFRPGSRLSSWFLKIPVWLLTLESESNPCPTTNSITAKYLNFQALKNSGKHLVLTIRHEPQPKGLREVIFLRRKNHPIGLNICGGINSPPANSADLTDEGIFIERIEKGSSADDCGRLVPGMRLLEINDDSLLGCTQIEAANLFRKAEGTIRLLICDGFNTPELVSLTK